MSKLKSIENLSFEEALTELDEIVKNIDSGQENLADAVASFERGISLQRHCEKMLESAKLKIEKITNKEGEINIEPVES